MKKSTLSAGFSAALLFGLMNFAQAADLAVVAKAAPPPAVPASCATVPDFLLSSCILSWYGITLYGTVDVGGTYQTHGTPFDPNHPVGASYLLGNSGTNAVGRTAGFGLGPNALSQSNIGVKWNEPVGNGWAVVGLAELAFDPYSGLLANAPRAEFNAIGVPENQQLIPYDSSRWGWLASQIATGVANPVWGTLTFGRQNTPLNDAVVAYDPMGASYAFSVIGNSGLTCGAGDTETCRWTTEIKYRVNVANWRFVVAGQPVGGSNGGYDSYNPNNGAVEGGVGGDFRGLGPGVLSVDVFGAWEKDAVNWSTLFTAVGGVGPPPRWAGRRRLHSLEQMPASRRRFPTIRRSWPWPNIASVLGQTRRRRSWVNQLLRRRARAGSHSPFTRAMSISSTRTRVIRRRPRSAMMASSSTSSTPPAAH
jgi:hypothetical protein